MRTNAIEASNETIRVGEVTRNLRFTDQVISNWLFRDGAVVGEGQWLISEWSPQRVSEYLSVPNFLRRPKIARIAGKISRAFPQWVDEYDYDDEGDYRERTPGLRGWIAWHTPIERWMTKLARLMSDPGHTLTIIGCTHL